MEREYVSVVQNELITTFGRIIQSKVLSNVKKSLFYSVLADETTDISEVEQFSPCLRYVDEDSFKIREDFLMFVPVHEVTGSAKTVLDYPVWIINFIKFRSRFK